MIYCALDNALQTTGWAIFSDKHLVTYGTFTTKNTDPIEKRLGQFWTELNKLYAEYSFEYLIFEDSQKQQNAQTFAKLSMVKAAILLWCYFNEIKYSILSPSHWRKIIKENYDISYGRKREEQKKAAIDFTKQQYDLDVVSDAADAINLGLAGIIEHNQKRSAF